MEILNNYIPILLNILLALISMMWVNYDFIKRTNEFWHAIKGKDKILQITEICIYVWVRLLPIIILADLFLNYTLEPEAWYSLDAIFFGLILGDLGHKHLNIKKEIDDNHKKDDRDIQT
jgi:hypothetical protein